jgi:hypothetical protein
MDADKEPDDPKLARQKAAQGWGAEWPMKKRPAQPTVMPISEAAERAVDLHSRAELASARLAALLPPAAAGGAQWDSVAAAAAVRNLYNTVAEPTAATAFAQVPEALVRLQWHWSGSSQKLRPTVDKRLTEIAAGKQQLSGADSDGPDVLLVEFMRTEQVMSRLAASAVRGPAGRRRGPAGDGGNELELGGAPAAGTVMLVKALRPQAVRTFLGLRSARAAGRNPRPTQLAAPTLAAAPTIRAASRAEPGEVTATVAAVRSLRRLSGRLAIADPASAVVEREALRCAVAPWLQVVAAADFAAAAPPCAGAVWDDPTGFFCRRLLCIKAGGGGFDVTAAMADENDALVACLCAAAVRGAQEGAGGDDGIEGGGAAGASKWKGLAAEVGQLVLLWWAGWVSPEQVLRHTPCWAMPSGPPRL